MRQAYSKETEYSVMELYVSGDNFQEISAQVGVSVGYVSSVKEKYEEKLGKGDLDATHEFTKKLRKLGISPQQALIGARTFSLLEENKLKPEGLELFLKKVSKIIQEKDYDLETIINAYEKALILESKLKVPLEHLPAEYENLVNKATKLQKEVSELASAKEKAETELKNSIKNARLTSENIQQFVIIKNELQKNDIDYSNLPKLCTILKRSEEVNFDFQKITQHLEKETDYESRIAQLEDKIRTLEAHEANLQAKNEEISGKITQNKDQLQQTEQLKKLRIPTPDFNQFSKKIIEISKMHDISPKNAFSIFVKSLSKYDTLKGFQKELERFKNEIAKKSSELETLTLKRENFEIKYKDNLYALGVLKKLKHQRVGPELIVNWNKILESSKLDVESFSKQLRQSGNLEQMINTLEGKIEQLQKVLQKFELHKKWLEENIGKLESKLHNVDQIVNNSLENFLSDAQKKISEVSLYVTNTISETNKTTLENLDNQYKTAQQFLERRISEFDSWVNKSLEESKKLGKLEWVLAFYDFVLGESFAPSKDIPIVITILERLSINIKHQHLDSGFSLSHIRQVKKDLEEILIANA